MVGYDAHQTVLLVIGTRLSLCCSINCTTSYMLASGPAVCRCRSITSPTRQDRTRRATSPMWRSDVGTPIQL